MRRLLSCNLRNQSEIDMKHAHQFRFWTFENGTPVRLKIERGQRLNWWTFSEDEEGWSSRMATWSIDDEHDVLVFEFVTKGRDCDGRHEFGGKMVCPLADLEGGRYVAEDDCSYPDWDWDDSEGWQRDEFAEAAGY